MSLFQAREWWSFRSDGTEEFDTSSFIVADVFGKGEDKIIAGSLMGTIRMWSPHSQSSSGGGNSPTDGPATLPPSKSATAGVEDLLLEERLNAPILALAVGRFSSITAGDAKSLFYKLNRLYSHEFATTVGAHFSPANMTFGPFGQIAGDVSLSTAKDAIAVQSMDGQLAFFEQERFAFRRNLNSASQGAPSNALTYLLPGPIVYVPRTDSIITINSEMRVDSFRYASLAAALSADAAPSAEPLAGTLAVSTSAATAELSGGRKLRPDWTVSIGEHAHHLGVGRISAAATAAAIAATATSTVAASMNRSSDQNTGSSIAPCEIAVAGERSFFVLRDSGPMFANSPIDGTSSPAITALASAIRSQRKLDYIPACMAVYDRTGHCTSASTVQALMPEVFGFPFGVPRTPTASTNGIIFVSQSGVCNIYKGDSLLWAARLPPNFTASVTAAGRQQPQQVLPVGVAVGKFSSMPGMLVFLSSRGDISVCYCGTDPPLGSITGGENVRDIDYASMEKEHRSLLAKIREMNAASAQPDKAGGSGLLVEAKIPPMLDTHQRSAAFAGGGVRSTIGMRESKLDDAFTESTSVDYSTIEWEEEGSEPPQQTLTISLQLSCTLGSATDVQVSVRTPSWAIVPRDKRTFRVYEPISTSGGSVSVDLPFACSKFGLPSADTEVVVAVTFVNGNGENKVATGVFNLPLCLAATVTLPVKTAAYKLTLDINRPQPPALSDLFADCVNQPPSVLPSTDAMDRIISSAPAVLSFAFRCGGDVTILASKAAGRFRIQAGSMEALALVASQLCQRLRRFFGPGGAGFVATDAAIQIQYNDPLPLADFFAAVDAHYALRRQLLQAYSDLNDRAHEYRLVAKRLLVRWKEKSPQPLNGLDKMLESAQTNVMNAGAKVGELQDALVAAGNVLSCCTQVFLLLVEVRFCLSPKSVALLCSLISPTVVDTLEQGWEEMVDAGLAHLLRAFTSTGPLEDAVNANASQVLRLPEDTSRVKSHITVLLDRLSRAGPTTLEELLAAGTAKK